MAVSQNITESVVVHVLTMLIDRWQIAGDYVRDSPQTFDEVRQKIEW